MSEFELMFSFITLLLGLAMAQLLGDAGRVIDQRKSIRIGWLTPLLAVLVVMDVSSNWIGFFAMRSAFTVNLTVLFFLLFICSAYYLVATLVFPSNLNSVSDLDEHYWSNRRIVLGTIFLVNLIGALWNVWRGTMSQPGLILYAIFFVLLIATALARGNRMSIFWLASLCVFYSLLDIASALLA